MIYIWRGYHSYKLLELVQQTLSKDELLIPISPFHNEFSFIRSLPEGPIELAGDWAGVSPKTESHIRESLAMPRSAISPIKPNFGAFTSGTSAGYSRLVLYSRENIETSLQSIRSLFDTKRIKSIFCFPQPTHVFGLVLGYIHAAIYNIELKIFDGKYSKASQSHWFEVTDSHTLTLGAPAHFSDLISIAAGRSQRINPSYSSICGGAAVPRQLWIDQREILKISEPSIGYGASEASPGVTHLPPGVEPLIDGEMGWPLPGVITQVIPEKGFEFSGKNVCTAYIENQNIYFPEKILLGDCIEKNDSGRMIFKGRYSSLINRGGQKFSLEKMEQFVKIRFNIDSIAVSIPHTRLGEELGILTSAEVTNMAGLKEAINTEFGFTAENLIIGYVNELPLNQNMKPDRRMALRKLLRPDLPLSVKTLEQWLPHRDSAIWVDRVLSVEETSGTCEVVIDSSKNYFDTECIRPTSYIEWIAQSYAYVKAYQSLSDLSALQPKRAFLVQVKDFSFTGEKNDSLSYKVAVARTHQLGSMALVTGEVRDPFDRLVARAELKLFAD